MTDDRLLHLVRLADPLSDDQPAPDPEDLLGRITTSLGPRRRGLPGRQSRFRTPLIVALVLAVVLVPPAVAFHRQLLNLIEGKPAPPSVANAFERWNNRPERATGIRLFALHFSSQVEVGKAEGVVQLRTSNGPVSLWEAPQLHGGECWLVVFGSLAGQQVPAAEGSCDSQPTPRYAIGAPQWYADGAFPNVVIVHARVYNAASVELYFVDGTAQPMQVVAGHAVAAIAATSTPTAVVAKNTNGAIIQSWPLQIRSSSSIEACGGISEGISSGATSSGNFGIVTSQPGTGRCHVTTPTRPAPPTLTGGSFSGGGTLTLITVGSVTVGPRPDIAAWQKQQGFAPSSFGTRTCLLGSGSPSLAGFRVGEMVDIDCRNGYLLALSPTQIWAQNEILALTPASISLGSPPRAGLPAQPPQTICSREASSPNVDTYHVGERVLIQCLGSVLTEIGPPIGTISGYGGGTSPTTPPASPPLNPLAANPRVYSVSCGAIDQCIAVGARNATGGGTFAKRFDGRAWQLMATPNPSEDASLDSVSCPTPGWCLAIGKASAGTSSGPPPTLAEQFSGGSWKLLPQLTLPPESNLHDVSCPTVGWCMAIGTTASSNSRILVVTYTAGKWTALHNATPPGIDGTQLRSVSCASKNFCAIVGTTEELNGQEHLLALIFNGSTSLTATLLPNDPGQRDSLAAVSCPATGRCLAIGARATTSLSLSPLVETYVQGHWSALPDTAAHGAGLDDVACASANSCTAVGYLSNTAGDAEAPFAERLIGTSWSVIPTANPKQKPGPLTLSPSLYLVSCPTPQTCMAVGNSLTEKLATDHGSLLPNP